MKTLKLKKEELENMSYDDVAYLILEKKQNKMKIQELFKEVIKTMGLNEVVFEEHLADFFELLSTDKRFIMLNNGYWDLKINHSTKIIIDEDEDDEILDTQDDEEKAEDEDIDFVEDIMDDDSEDDLKDLVIVDETEENDIA